MPKEAMTIQKNRVCNGKEQDGIKKMGLQQRYTMGLDGGCD